MTSALDESSLLSDQDNNRFWYRRGLNPRSLIQPLKTLPDELTKTHPYFLNILRYNKNDLTSECFTNT